MPVIRRSRLAHQPRLVQRINNVLRQRALFQVCDVALELVKAADTNEDAVVATILDFQCRVVRYPPQSNLDQRQAVLGSGSFDYLQSLECFLLEVPIPIALSGCFCLVTETAILGGNVFAFDLAGEQAAG